MMNFLPKTLKVNEKTMAIRTDYRVALTIFSAFNDVELSEKEKIIIMLKCLYIDEIKKEDIIEAQKQACWFLDGGKEIANEKKTSKKIIDWEQDEQLIFSAVNKVANKEVRECDYIHWWTFLGYFQEVGESMFTTVINIRRKKQQGKKLEKYEQEFYKNNKNIIDIKNRYTKEEQEEIERLNEILK